MKGNLDIEQIPDCLGGFVMFKGIFFFFLPKPFTKPLSLKMCRCYLLLVTVERNEQVPMLYLVDVSWGLSP